MKKLLLLLSLIALSSRGYCAVDAADAPIRSYGIPEAISISTFAYTKVLSTSTLAVPLLNGILIDNPSTNTGIMHGHIGNCTSTSIATGTVKGPFEIPPSAGTTTLAIEDGKCLWLVSRHTSAESVTVQGFSQR